MQLIKCFQASVMGLSLGIFFGIAVGNTAENSQQNEPFRQPILDKRGDLVHFSLISGDESYTFRQVDFHNLKEDDHRHFIDHTHDFDTMEQMFGKEAAIRFRNLSRANPSIVLDELLSNRKEARQKNPNYIEMYWIIENINHQYVGNLSLFTPEMESLSDNLLEKVGICRENLLEIGGALVKNYQGKRLGSNLAPKFLSKLKETDCFQSNSIIFSTLLDNTAVHKIASKLGLVDLGVRLRELTEYFDCKDRESLDSIDSKIFIWKSST